MELLLVGLSHKTTPVELRERLAFSERELGTALDALLGIEGLREAVIVSTCNRTELYALGSSVKLARTAVVNFLAFFKQVDSGSFSRCLYYLDGAALVQHLFRVACGLESMVLGETEILGQVRDAYRAAQDCGSAGKFMHELFSRALRVGKRAHTETEISANAVSVSYAAVELARKVFDTLTDRVALVIGAGQMSELTARHLQANGIREIVVANRTEERARSLAGTYNGRAVAMSEVDSILGEVDVVISSTGAPHPILRRERVQSILRARRGRPLFLVDIAVPRDIEPSVGQLDGVFLYDIDDLESVVQANLRARQQEARRVEEIVKEEAREFGQWWAAQDVIPVIRSLHKKADEIRRREVEKALSKLPELSRKEQQVISALAGSIVNKILNDPTVRLRKSASNGNGLNLAQAASYLFDLEVEGPAQRGQSDESQENSSICLEGKS